MFFVVVWIFCDGVVDRLDWCCVYSANNDGGAADFRGHLLSAPPDPVDLPQPLLRGLRICLPVGPERGCFGGFVLRVFPRFFDK